MVKVSVVIPVYNVERYIRETLESVLAQTMPDFEIIVVDDGSSDRSLEICREFTDPRLRIVSQTNRGLAGARNTGIRHAQGEYIAFLDSDDLWRPEKLATHVRHLDNRAHVGASFCCSQFIDEASQPLGIYQAPRQLTNLTPQQIFCRNPVGNGSAIVIRRATLDAIRFTANLYGTEEDFYFDDRFRQSEDIECWLRIVLQSGWQLEGIADVLTCYRVNAGGLSANIMKQLESWEQVVEKTRTYAPAFVDRWVSQARAYQLRYLARRAVRQGDATVAIQFMHRAIRSEPHILWAEPLRTVVTLIAAYLLAWLPAGGYRGLEAVAMQVAGLLQRRHSQPKG